jgi:copper chaperone
MSKITLKVEGMTCGHCVSAVESAVRDAGAEGKVDLSAKSVSVVFDETKLSLDTIRQAIEEQGYEVAEK